MVGKDQKKDISWYMKIIWNLNLGQQYWNTVTPTHLHIIHGHFHTTKAEVGSCNRAPKGPPSLKYPLSGFLQEV